MQRDRLTRTIRIGMMGAIAFVLMYLGEINLPFFPPYLKYDPGDVPAMVATFTLGPAAGVAVQTIKILLFWVSGKSTTGWVGLGANLLAGGALVIAAGLMHRFLGRMGTPTWGRGLLSAATGALVMAAVLIPINGLVIYPLWGLTGDAAWDGALYISTPFNLFKGFVSSTVSLAFYRRLQPYLMGTPFRKTA